MCDGKVFVRRYEGKGNMGGEAWGPQVDVDVWRGRLWSLSLQEQGLGTVGPQDLGDRLQACFQEQRMLNLRLEPGVQVWARSSSLLW